MLVHQNTKPSNDNLPGVVVGAAVEGAAVDGAAVVEPDVAGLLQVTLHPLAPAPVFLLLLVNSSNMSEEEVNLNFFFLPQTLN